MEGINLKELQSLIGDKGIVFLLYGGCLHQKLIVDMVDSLDDELDKEDVSKGFRADLNVVFIELAQNISKYSYKESLCSDIIALLKDDEYFYIEGINTITKEQKEKIENILKEILNMSKDEIKKRYKELRRSKINKHEKGGGLGFYEIAKKVDNIEYNFENIDDEKYRFIFKISKRKD